LTLTDELVLFADLRDDAMCLEIGSKSITRHREERSDEAIHTS
jgi:hypothetical protein